MHVAMSELLTEAAVDIFREVGAFEADVTHELLRRSVEVLDSPEVFDTVLSSPSAFAVSQLLRERGASPEVGPLAVAERILAALRSAPGTLSSGEVAGGGHLNLCPAPEWYYSLLCRFDSAEAALSESGRLAAWDRRDAIRSRVSRLTADGDADLQLLLQRTVQPHISSDLAGDDALMLLGVCAHPELDVRPYLRGLCGKQNLPWYFARAEVDFIRAGELSARWTSDAASAALSFTRGTPLWPWARRVLSYRRAQFLATGRDHPEAIVRHLTDLCDEFYRLYQRPEFRDTRSAPCSPAEVSLFQCLTRVSRRQLAAGLAALRGTEC